MIAFQRSHLLHCYCVPHAHVSLLAKLASGDQIQIRVHRKTHYVFCVPLEKSLRVCPCVVYDTNRRSVVYNVSASDVIVQIVAAVVGPIAVDKFKLQLCLRGVSRNMVLRPVSWRENGGQPRLCSHRFQRVFFSILNSIVKLRCSCSLRQGALSRGQYIHLDITVVIRKLFVLHFIFIVEIRIVKLMVQDSCTRRSHSLCSGLGAHAGPQLRILRSQRFQLRTIYCSSLAQICQLRFQLLNDRGLVLCHCGLFRKFFGQLLCLGTQRFLLAGKFGVFIVSPVQRRRVLLRSRFLLPVCLH